VKNVLALDRRHPFVPKQQDDGRVCAGARRRALLSSYAASVAPAMHQIDAAKYGASWDGRVSASWNRTGIANAAARPTAARAAK
jgi:hypothetical protein